MDSVEAEKELLRRLPEIELIEDKELRGKVIDAFLNHCPNYFWDVPASSTGKYHQDDVCGEQGLLIHTKRAAMALERIGRSWVEQDKITDKELDYARASILLHDMFKYGLPPRDEHTADDHDRIAMEYLGEHSSLPRVVLGCIDSHNGAWYDGKDPETDLEHLHHLADMVGSDRNAIYKLYKPCEEVRRQVELDQGIEADLG